MSHTSSHREPVRYSSIMKPKSSFVSIFAQEGPSGLKVSTRANKILWDLPVPRIRGYYSRLSSYFSCRDGLWYGVAGLVFFLAALIACFEVSLFSSGLALNALVLFLASILLEMVITRTLALLLITGVHHLCYKRRKDRVEAKYNLRFRALAGSREIEPRNYNKVPLETEEEEGERVRLKPPRGEDPLTS